MKIHCHCGATIIDATDHLAWKGHLTPDQNMYDVWDGIDDQVIDPLAAGDLKIEEAYMKARDIITSPTRQMWQCSECGRLYIDGPHGKLHCFVPESDRTDKRILRARNDE